MSQNVTNVDPDTGEIVAMPAREQDEPNFHYLERLCMALEDTQGDGLDNLIGAILEAPSLQEVNDLYDASGSKDLIGRRFIFRDFRVTPSGKENGLAYMLVVSAEDSRTGDAVVITTGSTGLVAALVAAKYRGMLPAEGEIQGPKRVKDPDRVPLHMHWLGKAG